MSFPLSQQELFDNNILCSSEECNTINDSQHELTDINDDSLQEELAKWASQNNITREALNQLLGILNKSGHHLPKDARTLLQTPRHVTVQKCDGRYSYFGIASCLQMRLNVNKDFAENNDSVKLHVNIDGIPLYKSSNEQFWPILIKFSNFRSALIALYCRGEKTRTCKRFSNRFL